MANFLHRLGATAFRRWPLFILGWVVVALGVGAFAATSSQPLSDEFTIPGIASDEAGQLQAELFPDSTNAFDVATVRVVVAAPEGQRLDQAPYDQAVRDLVADLADGPQVPAELSDPAAQDAINPLTTLAGAPGEGAAATFANATADGRIGVISFVFDVDVVADVEAGSREAVLDALEGARDDGLVAEANGQGMNEVGPPGGTAELIGLGIALVVLVLTFGSLVAAGLPIVTAVLGVGLGLAGVTAMTAFVDVNSNAPTLATMIGLAVGIDYCLFILARYRAELEHHDDTRAGREQAAGVAVGTAGSAVVFAGLTVLIALAALVIVRIPFLTAMGLAAAATVLVAVLVALTLLPAVLGMLGTKAFGGRVRKRVPAREADGRVVNNGVRWARAVGRRPVAAVVLVVVALGALALPLRELYLAFPTDSTAPSDTTARQASELLTEGFGPGREAPFQLVVDGRGVAEGERRAAFAEVADWAAGQPGVEAVADTTAPRPGPDGQTADDAPVGPGTVLLMVPDYGADDPRTQDLLTSLRDGESDIERATGTTIGITGLTAIQADVSDRLSGALPTYLAVVVGLAFILLMIVFRSILVPLTATFGFLLSVLATLGVTVAVFQEGAFGLVEGQPIVSFLPIFLIGVVFGLAMDYQVFLVTRMREARVHGTGTAEAVVDGFRSSARVVAAAALIMTAVFSGFVFEDNVIIRSVGFALAVAVVIDAFVVRMTLIPALMYLLGERAWWLPAWLDRILPVVDVEGEQLQRRLHPADADEAEVVDVVEVR
ncbi:MMPL family transporter [Nocardioides sp. C4-1]|uniref:MMPL family transporter n=1 Tax=Nocardioides sp. C4-1 TaxID=3151851 RepID=UPI0032639772